MDIGLFKKICLISGIVLFVLVSALLVAVAFMAGFINGRAAVSSEPVCAAPSESSLESLNQVEKDMLAATAMLYWEDENGVVYFRCTATAFERESGNYYKFITAAHCVAKDDATERLVRVLPGKWFLDFDLSGRQKFYSAYVLAAGYQREGDDLAVLGAYLDNFNPIICLSPEDASMGEAVSNIAAPLGLGKQLFRGYISQSAPARDSQSFLKDRNLVQVHSGGGSSGSSIVSQTKKAIVGVLVAAISGLLDFSPFNDATLVVPVSKFHRFWSAIKARNYEYFTWESYERQKPEIDSYSPGTSSIDGGSADDYGGVED